MKKTFFLLFICLSIGTISLSSFKEDTTVAVATPPSLIFSYLKESSSFQNLVLREAQQKATEICNLTLQDYLNETTTPGSNVPNLKRYRYGQALRYARVGDAVTTQLVTAVLSVNYFQNAFANEAADALIITAIRTAIDAEYDNLAEVPQ